MDLNLGQTEWNDIYKRWGLLIRIWSWLREYSYSKMLIDRAVGDAPYMTLTPVTKTDIKEDGSTLVVNATKLAITGLQLPILSNWALSGINFDSNTDANGTIYVKALTGPYGTDLAVYLYKDVAEANLVASGSGSANSTITLAEQNDSGLSGTVYAGDFIGATLTDRYYLRCRPDWKRRLQQAFETGTAEDARLLSVALGKLSDNADAIDDMIGDWEDFIETEFIETYLKTKMQSVSDDVLSVSESQSGGTVTIAYTGILADLKDNMEDDTTPQTIRKNTPTASVASADADNTGAGSVAITLYNHAKTGRVILKCLDATIGSEYFEVKWRPDNWWEFDDLTGTYYAYVNKIYRDNAIGINSLTISRTITDSETGGHDHYTSWAFTGETSVNTSSGLLYSRYFGTIATGAFTGSDMHKIYNSSSARDADNDGTGTTNVVAYGTGKNTTVTLSAYSASGLSGTVAVDNTIADTDTADIDLNVFAVNDIFSFTVTEVKTGLIQKYLGDVYNFDLPFHATPGSETVADYYARRG